MEKKGNVEQKGQLEKKRTKEGKHEKSKQRKKKGQIKQRGNKIKEIKCRIGFQINFDLLQNSKGKSKETGRNDKKKETQEYEIQVEIKHINGIQN